MASDLDILKAQVDELAVLGPIVALLLERVKFLEAALDARYVLPTSADPLVVRLPAHG